jgi:fumarylacetoacetate (FAA) hydrolase family protein
VDAISTDRIDLGGRVERWAGSAAEALPADAASATLVGRIWDPSAEGPSPIVVRNGEVFDISVDFATVSELCELPDPATALAGARGVHVGSFESIFDNTNLTLRDHSAPWLLAPVDLQPLKAAGVTFAVSMIERVIEERVRGDLAAAARMRQQIVDEIGGDLRNIVPGSAEAGELKRYLTTEGMWSQYLEVGIGPDAEIFTKGQALSAVGTASEVGVLSASQWNNPEPEIAVIVQSSGAVVGATLGNDVNLRDVEGRSALLLPKAKDNNASCALGPLIRLYDAGFGDADLRQLEVELQIDGPDGFHLDGVSRMSEITRTPEDLVSQLIGRHHQYPDGAVLMLGTMFAPVVDRGDVGKGFTHRQGDVVRISTAALGSLVNRVRHSEDCDPWSFGMTSLMRNLAHRKLL